MKLAGLERNSVATKLSFDPMIGKLKNSLISVKMNHSLLPMCIMATDTLHLVRGECGSNKFMPEINGCFAILIEPLSNVY